MARDGMMARCAGWIGGLLLAMTGTEASAAPAPIAHVEGGDLEGNSEGSLDVYRGIPFAAPPVGRLRWRPPTAAEPWTGLRPATSFAPACMQIVGGTPVSGYNDLHVGEDCLYLNVWTPAHKAGERLPVMVWIYGGGFIGGATSTAMYDGANLARKGVVLVSLAYRVGPFGFLAHPELSAESSGHGSGNYGLLDQIAGLQWIARNIAAFGGDPGRVTIFGESAGGIAVSILAASPLAKGLFHGVISESGGSFAPPRQGDAGGENILPQAVAEARGAALLRRLGARNIDDARKLPPQALNLAAGNVLDQFWPTLDGHVIVEDQYKLYRAGRYNDTPLLVGTNSDEGALIVQATSDESYAGFVRASFGPFAERILARYAPGPGDQTLHAHRDVLRDIAFGWHSWAWARLQSRTGKGPVFAYYFDRRPPYPDRPPYHNWGAAHGAEMPYVFGNYARPEFVWTDADRHLSDTISSYWVNFAKTGDPNGANLPTWPAFTEHRQKMMWFDQRAHPGPVANLDKLMLWEDYYAWRRSENTAGRAVSDSKETVRR